MTKTKDIIWMAPYPDRILDDVGFGFASGVVGSPLLQFIEGIYRSPKGNRLAGGFQAVRIGDLSFASSSAVFFGMASFAQCSLAYLRQKDDPWNSIFGFTIASGLCDRLGRGAGPAARCALAFGVGLAFYEGS